MLVTHATLAMWRLASGYSSFGSKTKAEAVDEAASVLSTISPDDFTSTLITKKPDYVYAEF